jgi:hypothetical protein
MNENTSKYLTFRERKKIAGLDHFGNGAPGFLFSKF